MCFTGRQQRLYLAVASTCPWDRIQQVTRQSFVTKDDLAVGVLKGGKPDVSEINVESISTALQVPGTTLTGVQPHGVRGRNEVPGPDHHLVAVNPQ